MAHEDDLFIARHAVERKLITRDQLQDALLEMYQQERVSGGERWPLGVQLITLGYLSEPVVLSLLAQRVQAQRQQLTSSQAEDLDFGRLLVATGTLEPDQVNHALSLQQQQWTAGQPSHRIGEIVVELGYATPDEIQRVLAYHRTSILVCSSCRVRYNAANATRRASYKCPKCGGTLNRARQLEYDESVRLTDPGRGTSHRPTAPLPVPQASVGEQAQIDRALTLYLRQMSLATLETIHEAQRIQLEMSRFGVETALLDLVKRLGMLTPRQAAEIERIDFASVVHGPGWTKQTVPGYKPVRKIATGASSTLFAAEPVVGGGLVTLKILHPDRARDPQAIARFKREAELLVTCEHPALVKAIETGQVPSAKAGHPGIHFLTLEYVDSEALDHRLATRGAISPKLAVRITAQIGHALHYLERKGVVHHDVRPEHVLIDGHWGARLSDLGHARIISELPVGGPGIATDISALGMLLHVMLAGSPRWPGSESGSAGDPVTLDLPPVNAPPGVMAVLDRLLNPASEARIKNYPDLLEALKQA